MTGLLLIGGLTRGVLLTRAPLFIRRDSIAYFQVGYELANGLGFDLPLRRTPLYPLFVAGDSGRARRGPARAGPGAASTRAGDGSRDLLPGAGHVRPDGWCPGGAADGDLRAAPDLRALHPGRAAVHPVVDSRSAAGGAGDAAGHRVGFTLATGGGLGWRWRRSRARSGRPCCRWRRWRSWSTTGACARRSCTVPTLRADRVRGRAGALDAAKLAHLGAGERGRCDGAEPRRADRAPRRGVRFAEPGQPEPARRPPEDRGPQADPDPDEPRRPTERDQPSHP